MTHSPDYQNAAQMQALGCQDKTVRSRPGQTGITSGLSGLARAEGAYPYTQAVTIGQPDHQDLSVEASEDADA